MRVTDPVILSPVPGSGSPFPSGLPPKSAVKTEVGKLFFSSRWPQVAGMEATGVLWRQHWLQDGPLRGHK